MNLADLSIKRPIMMTMVLLVFVLFGAMAFFGMTLDLFPSVDIPYITIQTVYSGAGPKEIEIQVTKKIEDEISSISKIEQITSYSMDGVSLIMVEFELDKDVNIAKQEVKDKVDAILNELPDDAEVPIIQKLDIQEFPIVEVVLSGDMPQTELFNLADKKLSDRFAQLDGVGSVEVSGGEEREIEIVLDNRVVFQNSISLSQLSQIIQANNMDMPGGHFIKNTQEYTVRLDGEFDNVESIGELEIPTAYGNKLLKDIAEIKDKGAEVRERTSLFNNIEKTGKPEVVLLSLTKSTDGNTVDIANAVRKLIPELEETLPTGSSLEIVTDESVFIESTVQDTLTNILLGIILTALVLLFFLHDFRSTIIAALAMPISIISTFMLMNMAGFSMNIMSLMGLSTSVGILVANSVVILENIFRYKELGKGRVDAASVGTNEIATAVIASTLTNIAVFIPIAMMSSLVGQFFREFALTVAFATVFSLLVSFTLTPMLASIILPDKIGKKSAFGLLVEGWLKRLEKWYGKILEVILRTRKRSAMLIAGALLLFIASFPMAARLGFEFMPNMDQGNIRVEIELPQGYNLEESTRTLQVIEDLLKANKEVKQIVSTIGSLSLTDVGTNFVLINVKLVDVSERKYTSDEMANEIIEQLSEVPNAKIRVRSTMSGVVGSRPPLTFYLQGQDIDKLEIYKQQIIDRIKDIPGLVNLNTSSRSGQPEIRIFPDRKKLSDAGLSVYDLAMAMRGSLAGLVDTYYRDEGDEYDIRVMVADETVDTPEEIANISVSGAKGTYTLAQLAKIRTSTGVSKIMHLDKFKEIEFTGSPAPGVPLGDVMNEVTQRISDIDFESGYKVDWGGTSKMMGEAVVDMLRAFIIAIVLTYMLLAAILESFTQPLLILGTVPLALIGVFGGLFFTGITMNIISMMAIVMLLGIVVNNAILILDYTNLLVRQHGRGIREALLEACQAKLRAILMSTIAIMLGMLPMAMAIGSSGAEIRQSMGVVSIGGLVVSMLLSLVVIPALYIFTAKSKSVETTPSVEKEG